VLAVLHEAAGAEHQVVADRGGGGSRRRVARQAGADARLVGASVSPVCHPDAVTEEPDLEEAKELISRAMAQARGVSRMTKDEAWKVLLGEIIALDGHAGIEIKRHQHQAIMTLGDATAFITYKETAGVRVAVDGAQAVEVLLGHDRETGRFIGTEQDSFRTPDPGAPNRRRPAVAVVIEAAIRALAR
jgi:hypothetical protein